MSNAINSDLYYIKSQFNGKTLHFGFEQVNNENLPFWQHYKEATAPIADFCDSLCKSATQDGYPSYPNELSNQFGYSEERYHQVMKFIQKKGYFKTNPFAGIKGGRSGMAQVLCPSTTDKKTFMVYLSTVPVEKNHAKEIPDLDTIADYQALFGDIVISFVCTIENGTPTVSHYGIFRNPLDFLDTEERYKGAAMKLHGVAAKIAMIYFTGKKYMFTTPLRNMFDIMLQWLEKDSVHIGTNQHLNEDQDEETKELLKKYPPIYHIDTKTGIRKIAKKGVDLRQYLDHLPFEKAEFVGQPKDRFNPAGGNLGAIVTVIDLEKLANFGGEIEVSFKGSRFVDNQPIFLS